MSDCHFSRRKVRDLGLLPRGVEVRQIVACPITTISGLNKQIAFVGCSDGRVHVLKSHNSFSIAFDNFCGHGLMQLLSGRETTSQPCFASSKAQSVDLPVSLPALSLSKCSVPADGGSCRAVTAAVRHNSVETVLGVDGSLLNQERYEKHDNP
eukprot:765648-Hanusia_phi.AAC.2